MKEVSELTKLTATLKARRRAGPKFLVRLEPRHKVFLSNLGDLLWPWGQPPLATTSHPGEFWPDVFVTRPLPWRRFLESTLYHAAVIVLLWTSTRYWPRRPEVLNRPVFHESDVIYYTAAEYLPPLNTGTPSQPAQQTGAPAYAPQPILSVPPEADNRSQTIVTPPDINLTHDLPLPNVVAWSHPLPAIPLAAAPRPVSDLKLAGLPTSVVAPPPDLNATSSQRTLYQPSAVVEPPPSLENTATRKLGDINIGHAEVVAPAPLLPMAQQRTRSANSAAGLGSAGAAVVPPPPSMEGAGTGSGGGRMIALGIHPAQPRGPVEVPAGNRRGAFAATPQGKPGAAGTPDGPTGGHNGAGGKHGSGNGAGGGTSGAPPGLYVGAGAKPGETSTVAGAGSSKGNTLIADATAPRASSVPRAATAANSNATELEKKVFGDRKFYSMTLNMPNLNSAGGSWVIHFAELKDDGQKGDLAAPVAVLKADPAYPLELMRQNVQGTVALRAIIHRDGSVGDISVLRGVDDRLDEYARSAMARWHFRPATKNGSAVDLEAVVMIPFRPARARSGY